VHGVSTRKVDDLVKALGGAAGISKSEVSRICAELDGDLEAFRTRALEGEFPYVFADATYIKARVRGRVLSRAVVVATGVKADGTREVLGIDIGDSEAGAFWTAFFRSLPPEASRGCSWPSPTTTPGSKQRSQRCSAAPPGSDAGSISCATPSPGSRKARPRWSPPPSARSSPSPTLRTSARSSTRLSPCSAASSPTSKQQKPPRPTLPTH
jgi:putative transposase